MVRASELGEFAYCRRAWWLSHVRNLPSANRATLAHGIELHAAHGQSAHRTTLLFRLALGALLAAIVLVVIGFHLLSTT